MTKKQERNIIAACGTILFSGLLVLLLWLVQMTVYEQDEPEYVEVTLEPLEEVIEEQKTVQKPVPSSNDPGASSPTQSEPNNQPTQTSAEQIVSEEDLLAIRQQRIADSIAEANRQQRAKAENLIGGMDFSAVEQQGAGPSSTPQGGAGVAPKGEGSDGNGKWSLKGRGLVGALPKPDDNFNQEGWAEIEISVDEKGNVIDATFKRGTISEAQTQKLAIEAAKKAKFTPAKSVKQVGTITYYYNIN